MLKKFFISAISLAAVLIVVLMVSSCGKKPGNVPKKLPSSPPNPSAAARKPAKMPPPKPAPTPMPAPGKEVRVVIIIDDMGNDMKALDEVLALPGPVVVAVLPLTSHSAETAIRAESAGREVLLHLPMQPKGDLRGLGPGALMSGMGPEEIKENLNKDLASVPGAEGVNNHMGSLLTEDPAAMDALMTELKARNLFFIDSLTTSGSVACRMASEEGVQSASRRVFLDDFPDEAAIKAQLERLVKLAKKYGTAIAIGHPRPSTLKVLKEEIPGLSAHGVRVAKISEALK
ncbi:MAG: divergent polysaccharide deacetylase family protein [Nitrospirota bacterium]